jgi:hypothetical protein
MRVRRPRIDPECSGVGCRPVYRRPYAGQAFAAGRHGVRRPATATWAAGSLAVRDKVSYLPLKSCSEGQAGDLCLFEWSRIGQTIVMVRRT